MISESGQPAGDRAGRLPHVKDECAAVVLVGLGSNLGAVLDSGLNEPAEVVDNAFGYLEPFALGPILRSSLWRTSPVDCPPDSPDFVNAAAAFRPRKDLTPEALIRQLKAIEATFAPRSVVRNAPRVLDLDLLLFGEEVRRTTELTLPHPRALGRRFVLEPSLEVAPGLVWPGTDKTIRELCAELCVDNERVERIARTPDPVVASVGDAT